MHIQRVYIFDKDKQMIHILGSEESDDDIDRHEIIHLGGRAFFDVPIKRDDGYWNYGQCAYLHVLIGSFDIHGDEPDWMNI